MSLPTPDPIATELFRHLFVAIAEEMGVALERTAFSPNIKERRDHSCALFDDQGALLTGSFLTYEIPSAAEVPSVTTARLETLTSHNPLGVKGAGEAGTVGAPAAVVNAVMDALAPLGVRHVDMPLTPERVWQAIRDAGDPQAPGRARARSKMLA